jgi:fatty acid desaturase
VTAGDVLTLAELQDLRRTSSLRGAALVLHAWAVIGGAMALYAAWPSAVTLLLAIAVIGSRQLGLLVLMHEASHWLLFPDHRVDNAVARWLCAYPLRQDLPAYRRAHHLHHRHTQQPDDPDLALAAAYPAARTALWRDALSDLSGWTALSAAARWRPPDEPLAAAWRRLRGPVAANAVLLGALTAVGHWYLYPLLWLLPLATWLRLTTRLRAIAEHAMVPDDDDPLRNSRTTAAGPLARAFFAPYWMNYHLEHHLLVFVPCWKLRRAHALLLAKGYGPRMEGSRGYLDLIRRAIGHGPEPARPDGGGAGAAERARPEAAAAFSTLEMSTERGAK